MIRHHPLVFAYVALVLLIGLAGLTGCATHSRPVVVTKEVKVPIATSCAPQGVPAPQTYAADEVLLDGTIFDLVQALLVDREQRKVAELNLRAALEGCR